MAKVDYKYLGKRLKFARITKDYTQNELADILLVSSVYISQIETAKKKPSLEMLINICEALDISIGEIVDGCVCDSKHYLKDELFVKTQNFNQAEMNFLMDIISGINEMHGNNPEE